MSIQVAILKVLASHGSGRATFDSLKRDIAVLSASGPEWAARIKRLAGRVGTIDIFGSGYVLRDAGGWEITTSGREFLRTLEAVSQDNAPPVSEPASPGVAEVTARPAAKLIVIGHRFRSRRRRASASPTPDQVRRTRHDTNR